MSKEARLAHAYKMYRMFPTFDLFLRYVYSILGFRATRIQRDIGSFLEENFVDNAHSLIEAQRGEGKSLITCIFAIWVLIRKPSARIVMFSASSLKAVENATLIINLINSIPETQYLAPDTNIGRSSTKAWEVHHDLRNPDKSASLTCLGIGSNMQGLRADVLIADDVESSVNAVTEEQRKKLKDLTLDFTSICSGGIIIYLGTPQSSHSIYNSLPERGYRTRIWTGRYPTPETIDNYNGLLAPLIYLDIERDPSLQTGGGLFGDRGQVVDTEMAILSEEALTQKERDQGKSYFDLQYMLDTALSDLNKYPLKTSRIVTYDFGTTNTYPESIQRSISFSDTLEFKSVGDKFTMTSPVQLHNEVRFIPMDVKVAALDPSGGGANGDEIGCAIGGVVNASLFVDSIDGFVGGYELDNMNRIANHLIDKEVGLIVIEKNFGFGAFKAVFYPVLKEVCKERGVDTIAIIDVMNSKQKEIRIIDILEPIIGRGALIFNTQIVANETDYLSTLPREVRHTYSVFYQINNITRDRKSLLHDDRLDALSMLAEYFMLQLMANNTIDTEARDTKEFMERVKQLRTNGSNPYKKSTLTSVNILKRR